MNCPHGKPKKENVFCLKINMEVPKETCDETCKNGKWADDQKLLWQIYKEENHTFFEEYKPICLSCKNYRQSCTTGEYCLLRTRRVSLFDIWKKKIGCPIGLWENPKSVGVKSNIKPAIKSHIIFKRHTGKVVDITDMYKDQTAFLVCNGPSFGMINKTKLNRAGILTMGMNNGPCKEDFRPDLWTAQDPVKKFLPSIWLDPKIMKFALIDFRYRKLFDPHTKKEMNIKLSDCPNLYFHKRHSAFHPDKWFDENKIVWGTPKATGGNRSTMLAAIQILWLLGITRIYLLGCDFYMDTNTRYHFDEYRGPASIKGNQKIYKNLTKYFNQLLPYMKVNGLKIFNCNQRSHLKVFPYKDFDEAIEENEIILDEPTRGMYANKQY